MQVGDVVQFNENHKWRGSLGIITELKEVLGDFFYDTGKQQEDIRYMVGVPIPQQGTAYIYVLKSESAIEYIGKARLVLGGGENG